MTNNTFGFTPRAAYASGGTQSPISHPKLTARIATESARRIAQRQREIPWAYSPRTPTPKTKP